VSLTAPIVVSVVCSGWVSVTVTFRDSPGSVSSVPLWVVIAYECPVNWKVVLGGLGIGVVGTTVIVLLVIAAVVGGVWWFVTDDAPLAYYDARPAVVGETTLAETEYRAINDTAFNVSYSPIPFVGRDVRARTWVTVYASGVRLPNATTVPTAGSDDAAVRNATMPSANGNTANASVDAGNVSLVTVSSMSALKLGPLALNPVVHGTSPGLLDASGVLIDRAETYLPRNVSDVSNVDVRSSRDVTLLGKETEMTTLSGELDFADENASTDGSSQGGPDSVAVQFYVARVVHRGELVVVFGVVPSTQDEEAVFATLVEGVRMGDRDTKPGWTPPTPTPPGNVAGTGSTTVRAPT
jgi:hypothetical protein